MNGTHPDTDAARPLATSRAPLAEAARALLGPGVAVAGGRVADWALPLLPGEAAAVARAVPHRRAEFAAGRASARAAMAALGLAPTPLPRRPDGPPLWPDGVAGSITHGGGHVLAAVARTGDGLDSLGLDLEPFTPLPADLAALVCRPDEDESQAIRVFGAKEAAYKAQFALTGRILDFGALRVTLQADGGFLATFTQGAGRFGRGCSIAGRQALVGALLVSAARIR